jgi:hypothetical protein
MRKAKLSVHISEVKDVIKVFAIEIPASDADDLEEADILLRLRRAGGMSFSSHHTTSPFHSTYPHTDITGANYDRQDSNY